VLGAPGRKPAARNRACVPSRPRVRPVWPGGCPAGRWRLVARGIGPWSCVGVGWSVGRGGGSGRGGRFGVGCVVGRGVRGFGVGRVRVGGWGLACVRPRVFAGRSGPVGVVGFGRARRVGVLGSRAQGQTPAARGRAAGRKVAPAGTKMMRRVIIRTEKSSGRRERHGLSWRAGVGHRLGTRPVARYPARPAQQQPLSKRLPREPRTRFVASDRAVVMAQHVPAIVRRTGTPAAERPPAASSQHQPRAPAILISGMSPQRGRFKSVGRIRNRHYQKLDWRPSSKIWFKESTG